MFATIALLYLAPDTYLHGEKQEKGPGPFFFWSALVLIQWTVDLLPCVHATLYVAAVRQAGNLCRLDAHR